MKQQANELLIKTRRRLFGSNLGNNISVFHGNGLDFAELKEYSWGDDVRKINWKVTAREQKPYINVFNEERELNIVVAFILNGSIYFGSVRQKQVAMTEILAMLGFAAINNSDRLSMLFFSDKVEKFFKPTKSVHSVYAAVEDALSFDVIGKKADMDALIGYLLHTVKERSIIFLIGDFLTLPDMTLLGAKHEVFTIVVRDRFEESPHLFGTYDLVDPASKKHNVMDLDKASVSSYEKDLASHDEGLKEHCRQNRIGLSKIYTDEDPFIKLRELLK